MIFLSRGFLVVSSIWNVKVSVLKCIGHQYHFGQQPKLGYQFGHLFLDCLKRFIFKLLWYLPKKACFRDIFLVPK